MSQGTLGYESAGDNGRVLKPRKSRARYLVWAVGILVVGGMLVSVMLPSLCRAREPANRVKCGSNLRQIGQAIGLYAQGHGGQYPPSLAVLFATEDITAEVMICASSTDEKSAAAEMKGVEAEVAAAEANAPGHKHCLSYVYVGKGLTDKTATEKTIVAYEPLENQAGQGVNVLFGDGHVEFYSKAVWVRLAGEAGIVVGR